MKSGIILYHPSSDSFLMVQQKPHNNWGFPKGGLNVGETLFDAAKREFSEETGLLLDRSNHEITDKFVISPGKSTIFWKISTDKLIEPSYNMVDKEEINDIKWIKLSDIDKHYCTKLTNYILKTMKFKNMNFLNTNISPILGCSRSYRKYKRFPILPKIPELTRLTYLKICLAYLENHIMNNNMNVLNFSIRGCWTKKSSPPSEYPSYVYYDSIFNECDIVNSVELNLPGRRWYFSINHLITGIHLDGSRDFDELKKYDPYLECLLSHFDNIDFDQNQRIITIHPNESFHFVVKTRLLSIIFIVYHNVIFIAKIYMK